MFKMFGFGLVQLHCILKILGNTMHGGFFDCILKMFKMFKMFRMFQMFGFGLGQLHCILKFLGNTMHGGFFGIDMHNFTLSVSAFFKHFHFSNYRSIGSFVLPMQIEMEVI